MLADALRIIIWTIVSVFVLMFLVVVLPLFDYFEVYVLQIYYLLTGWYFFLQDTIPKITLNSIQMATLAVCVLLLVAGTQRFFGWLYFESQRSTGSPQPRRWPVRWTIGVLSLFALMFITGTSAVGMSHQIGWMFTSDEPMVFNRSDLIFEEMDGEVLLQTAIDYNWNVEETRRHVDFESCELNDENILVLGDNVSQQIAIVSYPRDSSRQKDYGVNYWYLEKKHKDDGQSLRPIGGKGRIEDLKNIIAKFDKENSSL